MIYSELYPLLMKEDTNIFKSHIVEIYLKPENY